MILIEYSRKITFFKGTISCLLLVTFFTILAFPKISCGRVEWYKRILLNFVNYVFLICCCCFVCLFVCLFVIVAFLHFFSFFFLLLAFQIIGIVNCVNFYRKLIFLLDLILKIEIKIYENKINLVYSVF